MNNNNKRRISKCECCHYYAKDGKDNKWKCARMHIHNMEKRCIFSYTDTEEECTKIIERWLKANE